MNKIFLVQKSGVNLTEIIDKRKDKKTTVIEIPPASNSALVNINMNRWNSQIIAFDLMQSDWSLVLEEDIQLSLQAISFVTHLMNLYFYEEDFRGINLGSYETSGSIGEYSLVNQGLHGQGSALTSKTWKQIKNQVRPIDLGKYAYDWLVEPVYRDGFVLVPNRSLFIDHGWSMPTHAPRDPSAPHYQKLTSSFIESTECLNATSIRHIQIQHTWFGTKDYVDGLLRKNYLRIANLWNYSKIKYRFHSVIRKYWQ